MLLVSWLNSLRRCFGTSFHILVFSIYWAQGFRAFPWTGISTLAKDHLKPVVPLPLPFPPPFHPITASHRSSFFPQTHSYPRVPLDGNLHSSEEPSEAGPSSSAAYDLHCLHDVEREAVIWILSDKGAASSSPKSSLPTPSHYSPGSPSHSLPPPFTPSLQDLVRPILSDCVPIRGGHRIPYTIITNALSLLSLLALTFVPSLAASAAPFTLLLVLQNVGAAMADVVIDAMVAEAAKGEK
ncbi:unnamed protein product [Closterium sp. NIES-64]|nr:unnamed protein product [Closterium sp. NIES-64]